MLVYFCLLETDAILHFVINSFRPTCKFDNNVAIIKKEKIILKTAVFKNLQILKKSYLSCITFKRDHFNKHNYVHIICLFEIGIILCYIMWKFIQIYRQHHSVNTG